MSVRLQRSLLQWLGVAVGLTAAAVAGAWVWLAQVLGLGGEQRLMVAGFALLALVMAARCALAAREDTAREGRVRG